MTPGVAILPQNGDYLVKYLQNLTDRTIMELDKLALVGTAVSTIIALGAFYVSLIQIKKNARISEAGLLLQLRDVFNENNRLKAHTDIRDGKFVSEFTLKESERMFIEEYLGMFEICERMLQCKAIQVKMFKNLYEYRIFNIRRNTAMFKKILVYEYYDWKTFYELLARIYGSKWDNFYAFLEGIGLKYNEVETDADFKARIGEEKYSSYLRFLKELGFDEG